MSATDDAPKPAPKPKPAGRKPREKAQTSVRAQGRSLDEFGKLLPAERILLEKTACGAQAKIGNERPETATDQNTVRASFLRFLLLGGDERAPVHEQGARLYGAWISETLDLENSTTVSAIDCKACAFEKPLILRQTNLPGLFLQGSHVPGIIADRAAINGGVFLRDNFKSTGTVRLPGAKISGTLDCGNADFDGYGMTALSIDGAVIQGDAFLRNGFKATGEVRLIGTQIGDALDCSKAELDGKRGGHALSADRAEIKGSVFLRDGFKAIGTVRFIGARIGGDINFRDADLDGNGSDAIAADRTIVEGNVYLRDGLKTIGTVRLIGAQISGSLECTKAQLDGNGKSAIVAESMQVARGFIFRALANPANKVNISNATVGVLVDDAKAWGKDLLLDGFTYGSIGGGAPTNAAQRLAWLDKQRPAMSGLPGTGEDFRPQPWKHLQKVLREMGHAEDARQVAIALEDRLRKADLIGVSPPHWGWLRRTVYRRLARSFHLGFRALTGYGYRPMRLMVWMLGVWWGCAMFYWIAALSDEKVFAPSNPLVFQHPPYAVCAPDTPASRAELAKPSEQRTVVGAGNWYLCETLRGEYTGFSPLAYSLDVLLPLVDLQQQKDWGPIIPTPQASWWRELFAPSLGHATRLVVWFETLFGWLASLLLVAIVSGLTKRRED